MTEPTVRPDTRIWTRSVISVHPPPGLNSVNLALLRQRAVGILRALGAPALIHHGLHDAGLGLPVAFEGGAHEVRRARGIAGEVRGPLLAELARGVRGRRTGL